VLLLFSAAPDARAGAPTDYVRARIERLYDLLGASRPAEASPATRQAARAVLDEMFDWSEMAKRSLDRYWDERTAAEQAEFVRLFSALIERTYVSQIQLAEREKFQYLGDVSESGRAVVRTKIVTKKGREIPVDYRTRQTAGGQWKIDDLEISGVSLVNGYRSQFTTLIGRSSYQDLVDKLRALVEKPTGASQGGTVVFVGAGDIASCVSDGDEATASLLDAIGGAVFTLGDHAYEAGTPIEFAAC
jgi:phospholipid transport system substrate-binding protein